MPETDDPPMNPDEIAHILAVNEGAPVRITLADHQAIIPTGPCTERAAAPTETVPLASFTAVVKMVDIADGGETLWAHLHLSEAEWNRTGFGTHWEAEDAHDHGEPRILEVWASRFHNYDEYEDTDYMPPIPDDSPVMTEWQEWVDDESSVPPAPLAQPRLELNAMYAESVRDYGNAWQTVEVGTIADVTVLDDLDEWPEQRETPTVEDIWGSEEDELFPSRHPTIEFEDIDPLAPSPELLEAIFTINRHAKKLGKNGDKAYRNNQGTLAKKYSVRKHALYDLKTIALHRLAKYNEAEIQLEKHEIDEHEYWCFYVSTAEKTWSFHQPVEAVDEAVIDRFVVDADSVPTEPIDYTPSSETDGLTQSLEHALTVLDEQRLNANDHLSQTVVEEYQFGVETSEDIRWTHLH
jgi:hypothetical protein